VPKREHGIRIADKDDKCYKSAGEGVFTCFRFTSSKLEPGGARTSGEEAGVVKSSMTD